MSSQEFEGKGIGRTWISAARNAAGGMISTGTVTHPVFVRFCSSQTPPALGHPGVEPLKLFIGLVPVRRECLYFAFYGL